MIRRLTAALARYAACCGLLLAPAVAGAQLRCDNLDTDVQIRRVSFEGNATFRDTELARHIVSTPTDISRRVLARRTVLLGAGLGAGVGRAVTFGEDGRTGLTATAIGAAVGGTLGWIAGRVVGTSRCLRPGLLVGDIANLRGFYEDQGFPDTRVDTSSTIDGRWADIHFRIREGEPEIIDSLVIPGIDTLPLGEGLLGRLRSRQGGRYSAVLIQADMDSIVTRLRNNGRPLAIVLRAVRFPTPRHAVVTLDVSPGPLARIGSVRIRNTGIDSTRRTVVDSGVIRDLLRFTPGDIYSEQALFESERRFYRVGSFLSAEITPNTERVRTDGLVDVEVRVVEDLTHQFSIEPGYGTLDCLRARAEYTDKAFLHGLNRLEVSGSISKVGWANGGWPLVRDLCHARLTEDLVSSLAINYNATVRLTRPITLRGGLLPSFSAYTERRGAYQAYLRTTLVGGAVSVTKNVTRSVFAEASYNLEYGHTDAAETVLCFLFRACDASSREQLTEGDKRLAVVGLRASRDVRNHADSASAGSVLRLDFRASHPWIASDRTLSFNKGVIDAAWYHRAIGSGVIAARFRTGLVGGGRATSGGRLPPPQERLYAGGETSVRGFSQNELGSLIYVTDDSVDVGALNGATDSARTATFQNLRMRVIPAGGNAMYVGNLEYRLPGPFIPALQTILFLDVGRVWTPGLTSLPDSAQSVRWTPGVAFKYFSPIGPIQINFGYNTYDRPNGPVYLDGGVGGSLVCLSGTDISGQCRPVAAIRPPSSFLKRITLTIAFPPDF